MTLTLPDPIRDFAFFLTERGPEKPRPQNPVSPSSGIASEHAYNFLMLQLFFLLFALIIHVPQLNPLGEQREKDRAEVLWTCSLTTTCRDSGGLC